MGRRRVCFVTGSRAELGLMRTALEAIAAHPKLTLQIVVTGMHLDRAHGRGLAAIRGEGWNIDAVVPWAAGSGAGGTELAAATGRAMAGISRALARLKSDIVLVTGDRVEAFAAAAAGHLCGRIVAHVHGGDRAAGQVDDSLRHAITKLSHIHFPATRQSARRIARLGEDRWRIHCVGAPGNDGIRASAAEWPQVIQCVPGLRKRRYCVVVLHPCDGDAMVERRRAEAVFRATRQAGFVRIVIVYPNNDPGCQGIIRCWKRQEQRPGVTAFRDLPRGVYLGLLRHAAVLVGNSSSGIIEAPALGVPVVDVGNRQQGRQRSGTVVHSSYNVGDIRRAIRRAIRSRTAAANIYRGQGAGARIAKVLAAATLDDRLRRKLISY